MTTKSKLRRAVELAKEFGGAITSGVNRATEVADQPPPSREAANIRDENIARALGHGYAGGVQAIGTGLRMAGSDKLGPLVEDKGRESRQWWDSQITTPDATSVAIAKKLPAYQMLSPLGGAGLVGNLSTSGALLAGMKSAGDANAIKKLNEGKGTKSDYEKVSQVLEAKGLVDRDTPKKVLKGLVDSAAQAWYEPALADISTRRGLAGTAVDIVQGLSNVNIDRGIRELAGQKSTTGQYTKDQLIHGGEMILGVASRAANLPGKLADQVLATGGGAMQNYISSDATVPRETIRQAERRLLDQYRHLAK